MKNRHLIIILSLIPLIFSCNGGALFDHIDDLESRINGDAEISLIRDGKSITDEKFQILDQSGSFSVIMKNSNEGLFRLYQIYFFPLEGEFSFTDQSGTVPEIREFGWGDEDVYTIRKTSDDGSANPSGILFLNASSGMSMNFEASFLITSNAVQYTDLASPPDPTASLLVTSSNLLVINEKGRLWNQGPFFEIPWHSLNEFLSYPSGISSFILNDSDTPFQIEIGKSLKAITASGFLLSVFFVLEDDGAVSWFEKSVDLDDLHPFYKREAVVSSTINSSLMGHISAIACSNNAMIMLKDDGTVWQAEIDFTNGIVISTPVQVTGLTGVEKISAGTDFFMTLKSDGTVWSWGGNSNGQLGNGTTSSSTTPVQASGLTGITGIEGCGRNALALKSDGSVWTWGGNAMLGINQDTNALAPVQLPGVSNITDITMGDHSAAVVTGTGSVYAWGYVTGTSAYPTLSRTPALVSGLDSVVAVKASMNGSSFMSDGSEYYTNMVAVRSDGSLWRWAEGSKDGAVPTAVEGLNIKN